MLASSWLTKEYSEFVLTDAYQEMNARKEYMMSIVKNNKPSE